MRKIFLVCCLICFLPAAAFAEAFLAPAGSFVMETKLDYFVSSSRFDADGNISSYNLNGQFWRTELDVQTIYGMNPKWNLLVNVGLSALNWQDNTQLLQNSGISSFDLLLKYGLTNKDWVTSVQFGLCSSLQNNLAYLELGQSNIALEVRGLLSKVLGESYLNTELAFRIKQQTSLNELKYNLDYVYKGLKPWNLLVGYDLRQGLGGDYPSATNPDLYAKTLHTLRCRATLPFGDSGHNSLFLEGATRFAGRTAAAGSSITAGLCYVR